MGKNGYREESPAEGESQDGELSVEGWRTYRTLAARINYVAQDGPCIQYAAKEVCRSMSSPTLEDFQRVKQLARFVVGIKAVQFHYEWQLRTSLPSCGSSSTAIGPDVCRPGGQRPVA